MAATAKRDTLTKVSTALFLAADTPLALSGTADEWLQTCCDALEAAPRFSVENVSEDDFQVKAKYHREPFTRANVRSTPATDGAGRR